MYSSTGFIGRLAAASTLFSALVAGQNSFNVEYCSSLNTAATPRNESDYQSNGLCYDFCLQKYAFAVVQDKGCWCSNYAPSTTNTGCIQTCPGYPSEICGGIGVYGYIELLLKPSGTRGAIGGSSSTTTQQAPTTTNPPTTAPTNPSRSSSTSTWTPTPIISLETITGQVRTVTVTPTSPPTSQNANMLPTTRSAGGLSTGGAVGLTVGLVALITTVAAVAWFCLKKRRKQKEVEYVDTSRESMSAAGGPIPSRSMSENSRYVLGADGRQTAEAWVPDEQAGQPKSRLIPVDQRLDPFSPVYQHNMNKSRESVNTIRDDHDYSRPVAQKPVLRTTNPD